MLAGGVSSEVKYSISVTASPLRATASRAASRNERPVGWRRSSDVWLRKTRRGALTRPACQPLCSSPAPAAPAEGCSGSGSDRRGLLVLPVHVLLDLQHAD